MILDADNLADYLRDLAIAPAEGAVAVRPLSGGVSGTVLLAEWERGGVVVKQTHTRMRVAADWEFDRRRVFVERDCLALLARIAPGVAPEVVFADDERFAFGMTVAPPGGVVWAQPLRAGETLPHATVAAAELLARLQTGTAGDAAVARQFDDLMPLVQGRVDPFHRTVALARPELAGAIGQEVERLLSVRRVLSHGDFSPKNVIAYPDRVLLLDCETAHWGDPSFDVAFMLMHLLLDGSRPGRAHAAAVADATRFWTTYRAAGGQADDERAVVAELACLLLARVHGKSPLPTLVTAAQREAVTRFGTELLLDGALRDVTAALTLASDHLDLPAGAV
ncbi:aminoglycoside phosphotransferase family protein [Conexibacter stalactiti]|uniref:Aminoglycoside phosphotransferase family protein n=1 Tax=Conexibacter stalactiti TaxID=1940611 RepID=A0ABU4HY59_9ACTN|nr:aminoglycoside phosphotransferase family protein [Conexibacter stalactiti]MDW5598261.1 aminoglycoside phosphotransferase family protein [Conexibacter stalactiti]MEC5038903.1 aminoglycoside phosphotransferase family protein [Conexibacter stalactiti]